MRPRRKRVEVATELTITSMMDMFVIILVFLLSFFDPALADENELVLPTGQTRAEVEAGARLRVGRAGISLDGKDVLPLDDGALPDSAARQGRMIVALHRAMQDAHDGSEQPLVVECHRSIPYSLVADVLFTAAAAGWQRYRFVVVHDPG